ncbi:MAG: dihydroorotate dehydrogenase-like protein [Dysgonamonadaceae bacterium]|jgi:dihydroorotate dehydrogenase (fumarate)|nr:dihydroorotate dehydrogenase-like protein [Dysgonamonadaceae bacterium]
MENNFETKFAGLTLKNPIIIASSGLTNTAKKNRELEKAGAGAVVLTSLFEEQIEMKGEISTAVCPDALMCKYLKECLKTGEYLDLIRESKQQCTIPIIASVNCLREGEWIEFVRDIESAGADAIELNIFALSTEDSDGFDALVDEYIRITKRMKAIVKIPIIVKMSKYFSHIPRLAQELTAAGADGIVLFNRFCQPDIDINKLQVNSGFVFSSHSEIADAIRWTSIVCGKVPEASIAACTGIHDWEDVVKCLLSGAAAVEICSAVYQHGNEVIPATLRGLEDWMNSMKFNDVMSFVGKLKFENADNPSLFERIQFMKYFSNRD